MGFLKKLFLGLSALLVFAILSLPFYVTSQGALAQENVFDSLDVIKGKLSEKGLNIIDYSENKWGNLPDNVIKALEAQSVTSLKELKVLLYEAGVVTPQETVDYLKDTLISAGVTDVSDDDINLIVNEMRFTGESQINTVILEVAKAVRNVLGGLAVFSIVLMGMQMAFAGEEEAKITQLKQGVTYAILGLLIVIGAERLINVIYGTPGMERGIAPGSFALSEEVLGLVAFIKTFIGVVAVLMIVISGLRMVFSFGEEEQIGRQKTAILWIGVGLIIIAVNKVIVENLFTIPSAVEIYESLQGVRPEDQSGLAPGNIAAILSTFGNVTTFLLGFVGLIAFGIFVFGGAQMIVNYGDEEMVQKGKTMMKNAVIGIIICLSAFAIISSLISFK